jgi:hypothetical protein
MIGFGLCQRCGMWAVEHLRTHSYCWECNYSPQVTTKSKIRNQLQNECLSGLDYNENESDIDEMTIKDLVRRESVK